MGAANGSRECAPDDKLRDVNRIAADFSVRQGDGFRNCATHATGLDLVPRPLVHSALPCSKPASFLWTPLPPAFKFSAL